MLIPELVNFMVNSEIEILAVAIEKKVCNIREIHTCYVLNYIDSVYILKSITRKKNETKHSVEITNHEKWTLIMDT